MTPAREPRPRDTGAQPERTALSWSRTALANAVLLGLVLRLLGPAHPAAIVGLTTAAGLAVAAVAVAARRRYRAGRRAFDSHGYLPDARLPAACAALAILVGGVAGLYVITD